MKTQNEINEQFEELKKFVNESSFYFSYGYMQGTAKLFWEELGFSKDQINIIFDLIDGKLKDLVKEVR